MMSKDEVRRRREARGWSFADLASRLCVTEQTVRNIEAGKIKRPHVRTRQLLKEVLCDDDHGRAR